MLQIHQLSFWERKSYFEGIDFLIVGAGIVGYSTAIQLKRKYPTAKILIIERGYLPSGASSKNAGFACFGSPTEIYDDLTNSPETEVWNTISMRFEGLEELKNMVGHTTIDYQKNGSWDLIHEDFSKVDISTAFLDYLNEKCYHYFGIKSVYSEDKNIIQLSGFNKIKTSYFNKEEGQLDTGKLNIALHQIALREGILSLYGIEILDFQESEKDVRIETSIGDINSCKLIVCTNGFAGKFLGNEVIPARAQVLVTSEIPNLTIKGTFHLDKGFYYFRNIENRILLGGARNTNFESETTTEIATTEDIQKVLKELLEKTILPNTKFNIEYSWAGIMGMGPSKTPLIFKKSDNIAFGVRMGGMGVALGSVVGKKLSNLF